MTFTDKFCHTVDSYYCFDVQPDKSIRFFRWASTQHENLTAAATLSQFIRYALTFMQSVKLQCAPLRLNYNVFWGLTNHETTRMYVRTLSNIESYCGHIESYCGYIESYCEHIESYCEHIESYCGHIESYCGLDNNRWRTEPVNHIVMPGH